MTPQLITKVKFEAAVRRWFRRQIAETEAGRGRILWDVQRLINDRDRVLSCLDSRLSDLRDLWDRAKDAYTFDANDVDKIVNLYLGDIDELEYWADEMTAATSNEKGAA